MGYARVEKQSPISLSASLHAVPQKALAPYIIDEALGRWDPALKVSVFVLFLCGHFHLLESQYVADQWRFECIPFPNFTKAIA